MVARGSPPTVRVRAAEPPDAPRIAAIHAEAIAERQSTFDTHASPVAELVERMTAASHLLLVAERDGAVVGWAAAAPYSTRPAYVGIAECSIYVAATARGVGVGSHLAEELATAAERRGLHKLLGKLFPANAASLRLVERCGFRTVGVHVRHGQLDGEWRDVVLVEQLLG
jgi:phosphinothricin acetyltransferase